MKERLITSVQVANEAGPPFSLQYYLVEEIRNCGKSYGVKIVEATSRAAAIAPGFTQDRQYASELIVCLAERGIPPTGLANVLAKLLC